MFEILAILGLLASSFGLLLERLYELPTFPTFVAAGVVIPLLSIGDFYWQKRDKILRNIDTKRKPVPPERFYWKLRRRRILRELAICLALSIGGWWLAMVDPVNSNNLFIAAIGWNATLVAVVCTSLLISRASLYLHASQWFDKMTPRFVRIYRHAMYYLSENPDFLGDDPVPPKERKREKVY